MKLYSVRAVVNNGSYDRIFKYAVRASNYRTAYYRAADYAEAEFRRRSGKKRPKIPKMNIALTVIRQLRTKEEAE